MLIILWGIVEEYLMEMDLNYVFEVFVCRVILECRFVFIGKIFWFYGIGVVRFLFCKYIFNK